MRGLIRLLSSQYQDVRSTARRLLCPLSLPPQIADVACANVPAQPHPQSSYIFSLSYSAAIENLGGPSKAATDMGMRAGEMAAFSVSLVSKER